MAKEKGEHSKDQSPPRRTVVEQAMYDQHKHAGINTHDPYASASYCLYLTKKQQSLNVPDEGLDKLVHQAINAFDAYVRNPTHIVAAHTVQSNKAAKARPLAGAGAAADEADVLVGAATMAGSGSDHCTLVGAGAMAGSGSDHPVCAAAEKSVACVTKEKAADLAYALSSEIKKLQNAWFDFRREHLIESGRFVQSDYDTAAIYNRVSKLYETKTMRLAHVFGIVFNTHLRQLAKQHKLKAVTAADKLAESAMALLADVILSNGVGICAQGLRHDLVRTMVVYEPNTVLIASISEFLYAQITDDMTTYLAHLNPFEAGELATKWVKDRAMPEAIQAVYLPSGAGKEHRQRKTLIQRIKSLCLKHGFHADIKPPNIQRLILRYDTVSELLTKQLSPEALLPIIPPMPRAALSSVADTIAALTPKSGVVYAAYNHALPRVQAWIKDKKAFDASNIEHLSLINEFLDLLPRLDKAVECKRKGIGNAWYLRAEVASLRASATDSSAVITEALIDTTIEAVQRHIAIYAEDEFYLAMRRGGTYTASLPMKLSSAMYDFDEAYDAYLASNDHDAIENLFIHWYNDSITDADRQAHYLRIAHPGFLEKFCATDAWLNTLVPEGATEIDIRVADTNIILLTAIARPVSDWGDRFAALFLRVLSFIRGHFELDEAEGISDRRARDLEAGTYTADFVAFLTHLEHKYIDKHGDEEERAAIHLNPTLAHPIWLPTALETTEELRQYVEYVASFPAEFILDQFSSINTTLIESALSENTASLRPIMGKIKKKTTDLLLTFSANAIYSVLDYIATDREFRRGRSENVCNYIEDPTPLIHKLLENKPTEDQWKSITFFIKKYKHKQRQIYCALLKLPLFVEALNDKPELLASLLKQEPLIISTALEEAETQTCIALQQEYVLQAVFDETTPEQQSGFFSYAGFVSAINSKHISLREILQKAPRLLKEALVNAETRTCEVLQDTAVLDIYTTHHACELDAVFDHAECISAINAQKLSLERILQQRPSLLNTALSKTPNRTCALLENPDTLKSLLSHLAPSCFDQAEFAAAINSNKISLEILLQNKPRLFPTTLNKVPNRISALLENPDTLRSLCQKLSLQNAILLYSKYAADINNGKISLAILLTHFPQLLSDALRTTEGRLWDTLKSPDMLRTLCHKSESTHLIALLNHEVFVRTIVGQRALLGKIVAHATKNSNSIYHTRTKEAVLHITNSTAYKYAIDWIEHHIPTATELIELVDGKYTTRLDSMFSMDYLASLCTDCASLERLLYRVGGLSHTKTQERLLSTIGEAKVREILAREDDDHQFETLECVHLLPQYIESTEVVQKRFTRRSAFLSSPHPRDSRYGERCTYKPNTRGLTYINNPSFMGMLLANCATYEDVLSYSDCYFIQLDTTNHSRNALLQHLFYNPDGMALVNRLFKDNLLAMWALAKETYQPIYATDRLTRYDPVFPKKLLACMAFDTVGDAWVAEHVAPHHISLFLELQKCIAWPEIFNACDLFDCFDDAGISNALHIASYPHGCSNLPSLLEAIPPIDRADFMGRLVATDNAQTHFKCMNEESLKVTLELLGHDVAITESLSDDLLMCLLQDEKGGIKQLHFETILLHQTPEQNAKLLHVLYKHKPVCDRLLSIYTKDDYQSGRGCARHNFYLFKHFPKDEWFTLANQMAAHNSCYQIDTLDKTHHIIPDKHMEPRSGFTTKNQMTFYELFTADELAKRTNTCHILFLFAEHSTNIPLFAQYIDALSRHKARLFLNEALFKFVVKSLQEPLDQYRHSTEKFDCKAKQRIIHLHYLATACQLTKGVVYRPYNLPDDLFSRLDYWNLQYAFLLKNNPYKTDPHEPAPITQASKAGHIILHDALCCLIQNVNQLLQAFESFHMFTPCAGVYIYYQSVDSSRNPYTYILDKIGCSRLRAMLKDADLRTHLKLAAFDATRQPKQFFIDRLGYDYLAANVQVDGPGLVQCLLNYFRPSSATPESNAAFLYEQLGIALFSIKGLRADDPIYRKVLAHPCYNTVIKSKLLLYLSQRTQERMTVYISGMLVRSAVQDRLDHVTQKLNDVTFGSDKSAPVKSIRTLLFTRYSAQKRAHRRHAVVAGRAVSLGGDR